MTVTGTVLVLSGPDDSTADVVVAELVERGAPIARMDLSDFPLRMSMQARLGQGRWQGALSAADRTVELADVGAVYYRRPTRFTFPDGMSEADAIFATTEAQFGLGGVLATLDVPFAVTRSKTPPPAGPTSVTHAPIASA